MSKVASLPEIAKYSKSQQKIGLSVGLVVGSFDIVHMGHINLFRFAKKYVDILIVGLDNNQTISLVKGNNRPINNYNRRSNLLSDLVTIDKIFKIQKTSHHDSEEALENYTELVIKIAPNYICTHRDCDKHWSKKKQMAKKLNIKFMLDKSRKITNSGSIIKILNSEL